MCQWKSQMYLFPNMWQKKSLGHTPDPKDHRHRSIIREAPEKNRIWPNEFFLCRPGGDLRSFFQYFVNMQHIFELDRTPLPHPPSQIRHFFIMQNLQENCNIFPKSWEGGSGTVWTFSKINLFWGSRASLKCKWIWGFRHSILEEFGKNLNFWEFFPWAFPFL